jgi:purine nucleosidase
MNYAFNVPEQKKIRIIINTDAKNEADDQYAIVHHLLTPKFEVKGIIAAHFDSRPDQGREETMDMSYDEVKKVLSLMGEEDNYKVYKGAKHAMTDESTPVMSEGAEFIIKEALSDDPTPLYVVFLGNLTDLAAAYLAEPKIAEKLTAVWIGGGEYPSGGLEFNLWMDINAANVVFKSNIPLWQVPKNVYKMIRVSLAELQCRVQPCGEIGNYLFQQLVDFNEKLGSNLEWPHGESWNLGDSPTVSVLLEDHEHQYDWIPAPIFSKEMYYIHGQNNRAIKVYRSVDARFTLEDFYCKLYLNYGSK